MSTMKRCISLLLVLGIILGVLVPAAQAAPVEETASVNTDNVTIEGTNGFGNLLSQEIAENQEEAEAAYEEYPEGYTVTDLVIEGNTATVTYDTMEEATLVVALYTEDGMQMLTSTTATVTPDATEAELTFEGDMPEYFMASAYLLDAYDFSPLCAAYDTPVYTQEMQELLASTVNDYDPEKVLNLDDNTETNFAVYAEDTIVIKAIEGTNIVKSIDDEKATYVIEYCDEQITSLVEGNVFAYPYSENEILIVKVASITIDGTTVTINGSELELEEVFSHMKIENSGTTEDMIVNEESGDDGVIYIGTQVADTVTPSARFDDAEAQFSMRFNVEKEINEYASFSGSIGFQLDVEIEYYITWRRQFIRLEYGSQNSLKFGYQIKANAPIPKATSRLELNSISYKPMAGLSIGFEPEVIIEFTTTVGFECTYRTSSGFSYESGKGVTDLTQKPTIDTDIEFEGTLFFGIDLGPHISIMNDHVAKIKLSSQVGFELTGKSTGTLYEDISYSGDLPREIHDCELCISVELAVKAEFKLNIEILKCDWLSFEVELAAKRFKLGVCYHSGTYSDFGWGECPHLLYKTTVLVTDDLLRGIPDISVTEKSGDNWGTTNEHGAVVHYVPKGQYTIQAVVNGESLSQTVNVDEAMLVTLNIVHDKADRYEGIFDGQPIGGSEVKESIVASGSCGDEIVWTLYSGGLLDVNGSGPMYDYEVDREGRGAPWYPHNAEVKKVVMSEGITIVGACAFASCRNLKEVKLPDSVTFIGDRSFRSCDSLLSLVIPRNVTTIEYAVFQGCDSLKSVFIPDNVTSIGNYAFHVCTSLKTIEIPNGVTTIGDFAFNGCKNLEDLIIPATVNSLGDYAISYCDNLRKITFMGDAPSFGDYIFAGMEASVYYPGNNHTWTSDIIEKYDRISWIPYTPGDDNFSVTTFVRNLSQVPEVQIEAVYVGEHENDVIDETTIKTATFSNLVPDEQYVMLAMVTIETDDPLAPENLLAIDQGIAGEEGTLSFQYVQRTPMNISYVVACGASNKNLIDAVITFPEMVKDGNLRVVEPLVVYSGATLIAGQDYIITGNVVFVDAGEYVCSIRGIREYTGIVECKYVVENPAQENPFTDVIPGSFYYEPVMWAIENGITNGTSATTFGPNDQCMRAHVVTFLWRAVGCPEPTRTNNPFVDVPENAFYYKPVLWALENGITSGMDATHFGPTAYCNRAQVVTFLYRTMGSPELESAENPFTDVAKGSFYEKPVLWAVQNGITNGLSTTVFGPNAICNRAQIVTFLYRAFVD